MFDVMKILPVVLLCSAVLLSPATARASTFCHKVTQPPTPLICNEDVCDRDPIHIVAYLKKFYAWYETNRGYNEAVVSKHRPPMNNSLNVWRYRLETEGIIRNNLTPHFDARWHQVYTETADEDDDFCSASLDAILCEDGWTLGNGDPDPVMEIEQIQEDKITVFTYGEGHKTRITLLPYNGAWRLDSAKWFEGKPDLMVPEPPKSMACDAEDDCDRDADHFVSYITDFYKWYIVLQEAKVPSREYEKFLEKYQSDEERSHLYGEEEAILKEQLTKDFWDWREQLFREEEQDREESCHLGSDPIICAQSWNLEDWFLPRTVKLSSQNNEKVTMVYPLLSSYAPDAGNQLIVEMKPEEGRWKIQSIKRETLGHGG